MERLLKTLCDEHISVTKERLEKTEEDLKTGFNKWKNG